MAGPLTDALAEQFRAAQLKALADREAAAVESRNKLRDYAVFLREAGDPHALTPAKLELPSFKLGDVKGFPGETSPFPTTPGNGHLSPDASTQFHRFMADAATRQDPTSRDAATGRAAKVVAKDVAQKHGLPGAHSRDGVKAEALHEVRAQVAYASREIGAKLGVGPAQATLIGYSLERALEKEGFKVLVNHAIDKVADNFKPSSAAAATATGIRNSTESSLNKSIQWLSAKGVTPEALKGAVSKHMGKISGVIALSQNPEVVQRAAQVIAHSDKGVDVVLSLAKDEQLRKAVGTMTLAVGETLASVNKGAGSAAILAGSALRGDSLEETGRHAFRAVMAIAGGAAGGLAAGAVSAGFGSIAGGMAGAAAGSAAADYLIKIYDNHVNNGTSPEQPSRVSKSELQDSKALLLERGAEKGLEAAKVAGAERTAGPAQDHGQSMERQLKMKPAA